MLNMMISKFYGANPTLVHFGRVPFWSYGSVHSSTMVVVGVVLFVWRKRGLDVVLRGGE